MSTEFWNTLDMLVSMSEIIVDRPKNSSHPRYPEVVYPLDYGYLDNTSAMDHGGIDVWVGSEPDRRIDAIMCIVDLVKRDSEIKILIGCTDTEKDTIYAFHNNSEYMKGILIRRVCE